MLSATPVPSVPVWEPHLYDIIAHGDEVRLSPTCAEGHAMVMEIIERGFFNHMRTPRAGGAEDSGDVLARLFGAPPAGASDPIVVQRGRDQPSSSLPPDANPLPQEAAPIPATPNTVTPVAAPPMPATGSENLLSELTSRHLRNLKRGPKKATPADRERRYVLDLLREVIGDKPVDAITPEDAETFADVLAVWPVRLMNLPEFRHMSAVNIAAKAKREKRQAIQRSTQHKHKHKHKHIMSVSAFFNWLVNDLKVIPINPFRFIQMSRYHDNVRKKKDIFSV
ncbi:hypothetical protein FHW69_002477 [Luteibacter sp. Sphag1AF]|uniref:hypothetical protein n=1 Tax=Luteibacter sp. Sphag1AF TaxID=2587031 RepID=UPI00160FBC07|nr:hypothetical protein [Luteibacter sp. Sphag1AF]MBB3227845.1 hypothetical protein [Luteibacter sp. Sphag1AF]